MNWKKVVLFFVLSNLAIFFIANSHLGTKWEAAFARRLEFSAREWLGKSPKLDRRIKMFIFDDPTVNALRSDDIDLSTWASLITAFANAGAKQIFIDKVFSNPRGIDTQAQEFNRALKKLKAPVLVGAFTTARPIRGRRTLEISEQATQATQVPWLSKSFRHAYGPNESIVATFANVGHLEYYGDGTVAPALSINDVQILPHLSLHAADEYALGEQQISVNGINVALNERSHFVVNLLDKAYSYQKTFSLEATLKLAKDNLPLSSITPGDTVLVLPSMYTGNTDWVETPLGLMPGGFIVAAQLNSVLTGNWIQPVGSRFFLMFGASVLAFCLAILLRHSLFWLAFLGALVAGVSSCVMAFTHLGMSMPWFYPAISYLVIGIAVFSERLKHYEKQASTLRSSLGRAISKQRLDEILDSPDQVSFEPAGTVVTVMFIDIVGFSLMCERLAPKMAFAGLREVLDIISGIVRNNGGVVDKILGDGMLCYFGYNFLGKNQDQSDHPDKAVETAIEIQQTILKWNIESESQNERSYPLRIGINTAGVYIGDVGGGFRLEPTLIGHGVNLAKRLESACATYRILVGTATKVMLTRFDNVKYPINRKLLKIKHHEDLFEAYEIDPLAQDKELVLKATERYTRLEGARRIQTRWPIPMDARITVHSPHGNGFMTDFSSGGFAVDMDGYLSSGIAMVVSLDDPTHALGDALTSAGLNSLLCEIRWSKPVGDRFLHGIKVNSLNPQQWDQFLHILRKYLEKRAA
jgi:class 3 adenylate cyclase/CHASE2 domain-containing sensor protein